MVGYKINRKAERGLTLVELLVVVAILALASSVVLLTAPPLRPKVRDDAERFAARLTMATDGAISSGESVRLSLNPAGYEFQRFDGEKWEAPGDNKMMARVPFDARTTIAADIVDAANDNAMALGVADDTPVITDEEKEDDNAYHLALDPLGVQTPLVVRFTSADGAWIVRLDEIGAISVRQDAKAR